MEDPAPHELCFARLSSNESEICSLLVELPFILHGKSFAGSSWCNCGARLFLFIWGRLRPWNVICGEMCKGAVAAVTGRDCTKPAANASCRHEERLRMEREEWDPWSLKEKQQEIRFENRKISLEGVGETRKVGEERRAGKAEGQWRREKVTQKGGGEKERKREREPY